MVPVASTDIDLYPQNMVLQLMKIEKLSSTDQEITLSVKDSDIGVLYVVQYELLRNTGISFAGVMVKHPLTKECWMRVSTEEGHVVNSILDASDQALKSADELGDELESAVRNSG